ncbi:MAG TPA: glucoamylase family protein [Candidatus Acidoferrales bacterium]|nr:glucoamylase family protein [Candidatus Acidoferrales bacterium]
MSAVSPITSTVPGTEEPIRAELFSVERLEQHAESLAAAQTVDPELTKGRPLTPRVAENGRVLREAYRSLAEAIQKDHAITPAAEWLVDNFHIVDEQLREIREDLPPGFYRKLPKLSSGPLEGYARVFGVAWAFVAHTDSRFDPEVLGRFVKAYQRVQPLTIGELWAVAITLRIVLVENLRRLAEAIVHSRAARQEADALADRLLSSNAQPRLAPEAELKRFDGKPLPRAFAVALLQRLRDLDPVVRPVLLWLDERLTEQKTTAEEIVRLEHQQQAAMNVTVRNIITSMRLMSDVEWPEFFESVSLVDVILGRDTNFAELDFATRDSYRHAIESLSRGSRHSEVEISQRVVQHVNRARIEARGNAVPAKQRRTDPGYYLISQGRPEFELELGFHLTWKRRLLRSYMQTALPGYLGTIALVTAAVLALPLLYDHEAGVSAKGLVLLGFLAAFPASDLAIALINRAVTDWLGPRTLPRLELRKGVPEHLRTILVVPTLLVSANEVEDLIGRLEVHYLANPEGSLHFGLLSDWVDASTETLPGDDELLATATDGIARLNRCYGPAPGGGERFLLFHRRRVWNEKEGRWMGWERKRGKLQELNQFLRGAANTTFLTVGEHVPEWLSAVRCVITLDADTRLPPGVAYQLVGTMAHPLNRPEFSSSAGRVVEGYAVMQPRIMPTLPTDHGGSLFQKLFSGPAGIDAYASAVSDVYQDLFREGSYTGKGIYDVDAFQAALTDKVPENTLLSHDLFEGIFARTALVTDIELFEEFPLHYEAAAARQHRWARGDWQLLPWIFWHGPRSTAERHPVSVPMVGRWKMLDNLRRSLSAPATFLTLIVGWLLPPASPWVWTRFIVGTLAIPALLPFLMGLDPRLGGVSKRSHMRALLTDLVHGLSQVGLALTFLAYQTWLMCDAIVRTLARLFLTRKNLLEWVTAAQAKYAVDFQLSHIYRRMSAGLAVTAAATAALALGRHQGFVAAAPFLALWAVAPAVARWISVPLRLKAAPLAPPQKQILRSTARRTWRYFETFVSSGDHALPPDNFQEDPKPVVAHRTSPTNIGLYLIAMLSAHDLGWIGIVETVERLEETFAAMNRLELFRGHFYNWYDTSDLRPLEPKYVSSVDSGNLAGHLLTLSNGCRELLEKPFGGAQMLQGIQDCISLLQEPLAEIPDTRRTNIVTRKQLANAAEALAAALEPLPAGSEALAVRLFELRTLAHTAADIAHAFAQERADAADSELRIWSEAIQDCVESHFRDAQILIPWTRLDAKESAAMFKDPQGISGWLGGEIPFQNVPRLSEAPEYFEGAERRLIALRERILSEESPSLPVLARIDALADALRKSGAEAAVLIRRVTALAQTAQDMFHAMDFSFLFDEMRKLFSIGYRVTDGTLDDACYDLLASEARLTSFIAIAKGDVEAPHWFRLGRALTPVDRGSALVSWSGSMFEYLMPALVMRAPAASLLSDTARLIVRRQIEYGAERRVPWGVSESAYNARDIDLRYQYSAFGVPGLGLKRGLSDDVVIASYASALAAMVDPVAAAQNIARLVEAGGQGLYGLYESLDYTSSRVPEGQKVAVVHAYFAHHQGMTLAALANVLTDGAMCARFHSEPIVKAVELLLQERTPRDVLVTRPRAEEVSAARVRDLIPPVSRRFATPHGSTPRTHLLSNGRYAVMVTSASSGYSRWGDIAVTRWREDATRDCWGSYIYLRDVHSNHVWSAGYQPCGTEPSSYEARFFEDRAEIVRRDHSLTTTLEVIVSSDDDAEMRRVSITNQGVRTREIQVTSYSEICLTSSGADAAHPAFSNLFVQTEFVPELGALLATRRRQSDKETPVWLAHMTAVDAATVGELEYETDRAQFIGRGRDIGNPVSIIDGPPLRKTTGSVLDPIVSLRRTLRIPPGTTARIIFSTVVAPTREQALELADKHRDATTFERTLTLAWTQAQVQLRHLGIGADEADLYQKLANAIVYADASLRPSSDTLSHSALDLGALWACGISGDRPIVLALIDEAEDIEIIRQLLRAHEYWRMKRLPADLVIVNEKPQSYVQDLQSALEALVRGSQLRLSPETGDALGRVFLLRGNLISPQLRTTLQGLARVVLFSRRGTLSEQVNRSQRSGSVTIRAPRPEVMQDIIADAVPLTEDLAFANGLGGFDENGREYVTILSEGLRTPEPWINVIANPFFGFLVSESGAGYTWSLNSHENQLTPWSNDPVCDPPGEAFYIRDESTGEIWSPTASPIRQEAAVYVVRHGQGYSRFQHSSHGISSDLVQFVPAKDSIKISRLTLQNNSNRMRRLSVTAYAEWVLGSSRSATSPYLITEMDQQTDAIFARNAWDDAFAGRVAFADIGGRQTAWTADRREFLGRNGVLEHPAALERREGLSGKAGAGLDPCAALQSSIELRPGTRAEIVFLLGQTESRETAQELLKRYRNADLDEALGQVIQSWDVILGTVQVTTPEPAVDLLLNRWLLYQTLSCRVWGRAGFYQVSGAYGFRDQLQDVLALSVAKPDVTREQLLRAAARQFVEGDVQHWWHPPSGRGVRTRISDDLLWLPYAVSRFIEVTGEMGVLDEMVPFLEGEPLAEGQNVSYFQPRVSETKGTLFEHCARALDRSLVVGSHGLPLMGTGDWNDGMNLVGEHGKGESVWLGWFLHLVLSDFAKLADSRSEEKRAETWRLHVTALKAALEREAWDGDWYLRAYFDDGTPLGSAKNQECRIDSIAQSWAVISGAADPGRAARAMAAVDQHLVRRRDGVVLLLAPPFDRAPVDPGYIKGYVPGIRENGGQYTHAAAWCVLAFAKMGDGDRAGELFRILNPINHARSRADVQRYKVEPYVVAGDVYSELPHTGRGGWTWYTGSAGWLYRVGIESILGFRFQGMTLSIDPCIPRDWPNFSITFRYHSAIYKIRVENPSHVVRGVALTEVDGKLVAGCASIPLADDGREHKILVVLG